MERLWAPWRLEYVQHADEQDGCVVCNAAAGDDEDRLVVHRGERAFALLNRYPYSSGHLMVAPYRHGSGFDSLGDDEVVEVHRLAVQAIEASTEQRMTFELLGVKALRAFDATVVIVSLATQLEGEARRIVGTYLTDDGRERGAALAVLNATNRMLGNVFVRVERG